MGPENVVKVDEVMLIEGAKDMRASDRIIEESENQIIINNYNSDAVGGSAGFFVKLDRVGEVVVVINVSHR